MPPSISIISLLGELSEKEEKEGVEGDAIVDLCVMISLRDIY